MFILVELEDTIRIPPNDFDNELEALKFKIGEKYANRILPDIGLVIKYHDILDLGEGHVIPGDGASHRKVRFRLVVFRPFLGQILTGRLFSCSKEGMQVSTEFFDHIYIPPDALQENTEFDEESQLWCWHYDDNKFWLELNTTMRFRIESIQFNPPSNTRKIRHKKRMEEIRKSKKIVPKDGEEAKNTPEVPIEEAVISSPMVIIASITDSGLGATIWWEEDDETSEENEYFSESSSEDSLLT
eukprot:TRINITY_DN8486_c0_g1_i1.p1 TRINITY_DN8486_c0_g1~~TRINITY_DN8486_c0_g1_i1.p1  ORF type:complete len:243 (-),score=74.19 TRINITY_DN8486_c0_g1_i1:87-815(-)